MLQVLLPLSLAIVRHNVLVISVETGEKFLRMSPRIWNTGSGVTVQGLNRWLRAYQIKHSFNQVGKGFICICSFLLDLFIDQLLLYAFSKYFQCFPEPSFRVPGYKPSNFDVKMLLWSGRFKTVDQIPEFVS